MNGLEEPVTQEQLNSQNEFTIGSGNDQETFYSNNYFRKSSNTTIAPLQSVLKDNFNSEFGGYVDTSSSIGDLNNILMGGESENLAKYTKYEDRTFQTSVTWQDSYLAIQNRISGQSNEKNSNIIYWIYRFYRISITN